MTYWLYRLLQIIANSCPLKCNYALAEILGYLNYLFKLNHRANVLANLRYILPPETSLKVRKEKVRAVFVNFNKYLFEFFSIKILDREQTKNIMAPQMAALFSELNRKKQPFIIVSAHFGNWEIAANVLDSLGFVNNLIYQPHKDKRINDFFINNRDYRNTKLVPLGMGLKNAFKSLKKGEMLTMVGDWGLGDDAGIEVLFFGQKTLFPRGPAKIAVKTKVPIFPSMSVREGPNKFYIGYEEPISWDRQAPEEEQIKSITQSFASILEKQVRSHPEQWLIFRRIWPEQKDNDLGVCQ
ncbi:MAG: lysophospholipid acyltransferase family protein [Elusimicrobia bacterium]|nr:lysophospholipid acyltransferase family protein [Elusimicrobiota bacterium]